MNFYHELSIMMLGSAFSLLISAFRKETVNQRYVVGGLMLVVATVAFMLT